MEIKSVRIADCHTGIKSAGPVNIKADDVTFDNVTTPWNLAPGSEARITNNHVMRDPKLRETRSATSIGWRRPHGPPLPSFCPECRSIFPSQNYVFAGPYFYCWGNTEECIVCGYDKAELSKGVFDLSKETVEVLRAPDITREMIERLAALGRDALSGKLRPDEFVEAAQQIHPSLGKTILKWAGYPAAVISSLVWVLSAMDMTLNWKERLDENPAVVDRILEATFGAMSSHFKQHQDDPVGGALQNLEGDRSGNVGGHPADNEAVKPQASKRLWDSELPEKGPVPGARPKP
ncbi:MULTISPECIES: hypothetical protein [Agrobacterium]|uniref:hypothetical protein n=1 Tax=Agrobacterium TaxID=357 RepID=UPI000A538360|nr:MULTISPECIES: hypothetical protein [Agrobacterium]